MFQHYQEGVFNVVNNCPIHMEENQSNQTFRLTSTNRMLYSLQPLFIPEFSCPILLTVREIPECSGTLFIRTRI